MFRLVNLPAVVLFLGSAVSLHADALAYASAFTLTGPGVGFSSFGVLDINTGAFSQITTYSNIFVNDLAMSPSGTLYAVTSMFPFGGTNEFSTINVNTGAMTNIAATISLDTIAFSGSGTLFGLAGIAPIAPSFATRALYTIDPATGATSLVTDLPGAIADTFVQLRFIGNTAYTTSFATPSGLYTLNSTSGAGTLVGNTGLNQLNLLGSVVNGQFEDIAATSPGYQIFSINPATGAATPGATVSAPYVFTAVATPEPNTVLLLLSGFFVLGFRQLRKGTY